MQDLYNLLFLTFLEVFLALMLLNIHTSPKLRTIYDVDFGIFGDAAQNTSMLQFFKTLILIHGIITQLLHNKIYL